jgi:endoglycosylceramidase
VRPYIGSLALFLLCAACGDSATTPTGAAPGEDAAAETGGEDAAGEDAGGSPEAGGADVGGADAGGTETGSLDAAGIDGPSEDAGGDAEAGSADAADVDATAPPGALVGHSGRWLIDAQGRVLIVHGLNVVNKLAPYTAQAWGFGDDDATFLQANGFNAVRLGVLWEAVEPQPGAYDAAYVAQVRQTQQTLASEGIYTLLDWHQDEYNEMFGGEGLPAWAVNTSGLSPASPHDAFPNEYTDDPAEKAAWDNLYQDPPDSGAVGPKERLAAAEAYVAAQFAGDPWVLGYDVINEPSAGSASEPAADTSAIGPLEQKLMQSIRTVDAQHLVFYEPTTTFALDGIALPAFGDPSAGISFHDYCFEPGSMPQVLYAALCGGVLSSSQTSAISHASSDGGGGDAVLMTEFGSATAYAVQMVADDADQNMVPWLEWAYCGCGDPTTAIAPAEEGIVTDPSQPLTGSNINATALAVLERPYPQAIAGTPTSWSYDETTGTFTLDYVTTSPPGVTLAPGATTVVFLPALQYPNGYTATVTGGAVATGNGTQNLVIAANAGAGSVSVSVTKK